MFATSLDRVLRIDPVAAAFTESGTFSANKDDQRYMMLIGTVKRFNDAKGFGFLEPDGGGPDVFAHFSAVEMAGFRTLKQGAKVSFERVQGPKGDLAQKIQPLGSDNKPGMPQAMSPRTAQQAVQTT